MRSAATKEGTKQVEEAEKRAAKKLVDLYRGTRGGWSLEKSIKTHAADTDLPGRTREEISRANNRLTKDLDETHPRPDPDQKSLGSDVADDMSKGAALGMVTGAGIGGAVGTLGLVGGPLAAVTIPGGIITGAGIGATLGGVGGAVKGAFDHFF